MARPKKVEQVISKDAPETLHEHPFYGFKLDKDQEYFRDCIWDKNKLLIFVDAKAGSGKAQPVDTVIPTPDGDKRLGDLVVGDYVFDRCGNPTKVLGVFPQGNQKAFKVTLSDGRSTICCDEHLWTYYRNNDGVPVTETLSSMLQRQLIVSTAARYNIPTNEPVKYSEKEFDIDPYILGVFIGNGCLTGKNIEYSSGTDEIPKVIADYFKSEYHRVSQKNYSYIFKKDGHILKTADVFSCLSDICVHSYDKKIPKQYLYGSVEQRFALLQGLMDTDGSITYAGGRYNMSFSTTSKQLCNSFVVLCRSLGIITSVHEDRRDKYTSGISYNISLLCSNDIKYKCFRLGSKLKLAEEARAIVKRRKHSQIAIHTVEDLGYECDMVCIYVDNDEHLYLTNDFIVTHNTTIAYLTANLLVEYGFYQNIIYVVSPYGEAKQGFLPGDITEKSEVYFEPIYQAIIKANQFPERVIYSESLTAKTDKAESCGYVKCLTHTYLRGTNFENSVIILDESQNYSFDDLKKTLTRANDNCKVIVIGHSLQRDTSDSSNGFERYIEYYRDMEESGETRVAICNLTKNYRGWISQTADDLMVDTKQKDRVGVSPEIMRLLKG